MKLWQSLLLVVLLAALPVLSACEFFEAVGGGREQQQAYQEQLKAYEAYQEQLNAYQEQREAYNQQLIEAYNQQFSETYKEYEDKLKLWHEERNKQLEQIGAE